MSTPSAAVVCALMFVLVSPAVRATETDAAAKPKTLPRLDWERPVWCVEDPSGEWIRVQCDQAKRCLVAPNHGQNGKTLSRTADCTYKRPVFYNQLRQSGHQMQPAIAEAPPGWYRDDNGRVFQVTFDLHKRFHLGVGWLPGFDLSRGQADAGRVRFDIGLTASWLAMEHRNRHTLRALEGFVVVDDLEVHGLLFAYDLSHASTTPLLRITTFFGKPARHDLYMNVGFGLRLMDLHVHPHRAEDVLELEFGEVHAAWDIWQSADLYNMIRLETGVGAGAIWDLAGDDDAGYHLTPNASLRARFGLDRDGFHYLLGDLTWALPIRLTGADAGSTRSRAGARAGYEVIFLAVNDQPLSLRLECGVDYRDDLPAVAPRWDASAMAGVRFSFWAPARLHEDLPQAIAR